jgi:hypothetical protein
MKQRPSSRKRKFEIYEHLEHYVKKTTYAHRLQWLKEANDWVNLLKKEKVIPS